jgi:hypothetical protein
MRILLGLLLAVIAWPADWTTTDPEVLSKQLVLRHGQSVVKVRVRFTDDTTPDAKYEERDYFLRGADAATRLARIVYDDQQTLQGFEAITVGSITPQAPTGQEQAIQDAQTALNRRRALETIFIGLLGMQDSDSDQLGTSGVTVAQTKSNLAADIEADITNQARLTLALDELR